MDWVFLAGRIVFAVMFFNSGLVGHITAVRARLLTRVRTGAATGVERSREWLDDPRRPRAGCARRLG